MINVMMFRSTLPGGSATPVHVHDHEDEVFLLLQGSGVFWAGERRYELTDGGIAFLPRQVPHAYLLTSETVKMIGLSVPAGLEDFFRAAGWDRSQPKPEGWVLTPEIMARAAAATGQTHPRPAPVGRRRRDPGRLSRRPGSRRGTSGAAPAPRRAVTSPESGRPRMSRRGRRLRPASEEPDPGSRP